MLSIFDDHSRAALAPLARITYKLTPNWSHHESCHVVVAVPVNFENKNIPYFHQKDHVSSCEKLKKSLKLFIAPGTESQTLWL